ncbi:hypothetical protein PY78_13955, partial [Lacticaseibacillus rhamnosus]
QHKAGKTIDSRHDDAKQAIDDEAAKVIKAIDQDPTLTAAQKEAQKQAVATEADKAKKAIDAAGDADAVDQAKTAGIKAIDEQHKSGQTVDARKDDAKKAIDAEAGKVTDAIDHDATLTAAQKKRRSRQLLMRLIKLKKRLMQLEMRMLLIRQNLLVSRQLTNNTSQDKASILVKMTLRKLLMEKLLR